MFVPPNRIKIVFSEPETFVIVHPDGTLEYGPGYTPDAAAKAFWEAIVEPLRSAHTALEDARARVAVLEETGMEFIAAGMLSNPRLVQERRAPFRMALQASSSPTPGEAWRAMVKALELVKQAITRASSGLYETGESLQSIEAALALARQVTGR
jgi:hypothetical protein